MTDEQQFQRVLESQGMYKNNFSALYLTDNQIDFLIEYVHELKEAKETAVDALREIEGVSVKTFDPDIASSALKEMK